MSDTIRYTRVEYSLYVLPTIARSYTRLNDLINKFRYGLVYLFETFSVSMAELFSHIAKNK